MSMDAIMMLDGLAHRYGVLPSMIVNGTVDDFLLNRFIGSHATSELERRAEFSRRNPRG